MYQMSSINYKKQNLFEILQKNLYIKQRLTMRPSYFKLQFSDQCNTSELLKDARPPNYSSWNMIFNQFPNIKIFIHDLHEQNCHTKLFFLVKIWHVSQHALYALYHYFHQLEKKTSLPCIVEWVLILMLKLNKAQ